MTTPISVGIMGFSVPEQTRLKQILSISENRKRYYQLTDIACVKPVQVLMVKQGDVFVEKQQQVYLMRYPNQHICIVAVGHPPEQANIPCITGVLLPSRVFGVLDALDISSEITDETEDAQNFVSLQNTADKLQVLVVDDSVLMQKTIELELAKASTPLQVDFASSGEMALKKIPQTTYDFIFLDVMMPGIDGFETCTQIRKLKGMSKTPIIMLTSKTSALDEVKGLMAGCTTYLTKPFVHQEFHIMLERIMHWVKEFNHEH